jgi:LuxR family transcriptional regulator, maltose regulon positive regulatory protein
MLMAPRLDATSHAFHAKLLPPRVPADLVARPALLACLGAGLDRKLTLIAAPAGYGKTTLLAAWLRESTHPAAFLALDEYDGDVAAFVRAVVAALQTLEPTFGRDTLLLLHLPVLPSVGSIAATLATELAALPQTSVLALDDYHTLNSPDADELMTALLRQLPPQLHLVVATRREPALAIPRLRARGELNELRADHLRFDHEATRSFLAQAVEADVPPELLGQLLEQTEGWPAGLRLATLALARRDRVAPSAGLDATARRYVHGFLLDDVLAAQEPRAQRFLLATAILDRFCVPLCDAMLAGTSEAGAARELLTHLERRNLFLVPLGEDGWYRYHALFRDALHERLTATASAGTITALHQRASAWLVDAGLVEEAVRHALATGDEPTAAAIVERHVPAMLAREEWPRVEVWLGLLPRALVRRRPALLLARAWLHYLRYQLRAIPPLLAAAEALLANPTGSDDAEAAEALQGEVAALESALLMLLDRPAEARDAASRAWDRLPPTHAYQRGVTAALLILMSQALGEGAQAAARVQASLDDSAETDPYTNARVRNALCNYHLASGDLSALKEVAEQAREDATALRQELTLAWAHYLLGRVSYEWNELAEAEAHFAAVCALRHKCHFMLLRNAMQGLALTQQARGQPEAAAQTLATLGDWVARLQDRGQAAIERAFAVRLALLRGGLAPEPNSLPPSDLSGPREGVLAVEDPRTTRIRALLSHGTEVALRQATAEGAALLARYEAEHNWLLVVEVLGLQALAHQALGATTVALDALERALRLAEPAGRVRVFVDLGPPMGRLLALYAARRGTAPYLARLLAACGTTPAPGAPTPPSPKDSSLQLVEPLTRRELEVLQHLQLRRTNDEIARALYVSVDTVKKHTRNLYQKLQADGRRHAVAQAIVLGLLPPSPAVALDDSASA